MSDKCGRCATNLSYAESEMPQILKGGYSGFFCCNCMNDWNEFYHASSAAGTYREAVYQQNILGLTAVKPNSSLTELLEATNGVSGKMNTAMRELFELAKKWVSTKPSLSQAPATEHGLTR